MLKEYKGKDNELNFIKYLESKSKEIDWWFKNGNQGKEYFAIKYYNSVDDKEALFYPDFIIRFKNGKIGIFDPKKGQTATDPETADKAKALALKIKELGKNFLGGITIFANGIWYVNTNTKIKKDALKPINFIIKDEPIIKYSCQKNKISLNENWQPLEKLF
ncbi:MAG: hypothetical protein V1655_00185 [bacterium]